MTKMKRTSIVSLPRSGRIYPWWNWKTKSAGRKSVRNGLEGQDRHTICQANHGTERASERMPSHPYVGIRVEGRDVVDVVKDNGTRVSVITHRIVKVIADVIRTYDAVPECKFTPECYDCPLWKEVDGNSTTTISSTSTYTKTRTRTSTCQTPGWWGCLDETTTTSGATSTSSTTTTTSTSTCKTPGWFGCNDETTTTSKSKSTPPHATPTKTSTTSTATCETPGWFGCNDPTTSSPSKSAPTSTECQTPGFFFGCYDTTSTRANSHPITSPPHMPTSAVTSVASSSHSCTSSAWFGLVCVDPSHTPTSTPTNPPHGRSHCVKRNWLGFCKEWSNTMVLKEEI